MSIGMQMSVQVKSVGLNLHRSSVCLAASNFSPAMLLCNVTDANCGIEEKDEKNKQLSDAGSEDDDKEE